MRIRDAGLVLVLLALGCRGPRPAVVSSTLRAAAGGGSIVEVVVENGGGGEGEVRVEATLRSPDGAVVRSEREVSLRPHERVLVRLPFDGPTDGFSLAGATARYPVD